MIGGGQTIGTQRISRYLAKFDKNELTADTPYGVLTRRLTVKVDDTDVEVTIIDPFAALWLITSARGKISSSYSFRRGWHRGPILNTNSNTL